MKRFLLSLCGALVLASCTPAAFETPTQTPWIVQVEVTAPPPSPAPTEASRAASTLATNEMWVCADLAYGYSAPNKQSPVLFQMSQQHGWKVKVLDKAPPWYVVRAGDVLAFMEESALCPQEPARQTATQVRTAPTATPKSLSTATSPLPTVPPTWLSPPLPTPTRPPPPPLVSSGCPNGCTTRIPGCDIKGNVSFSGERIYHVPGGEYYNSTLINPDYGERWFCTEEEAVRNGWRKSLR